MMDEIQSGPKAAERMEFELVSRLAAGSRFKEYPDDSPQSAQAGCVPEARSLQGG